MKILVPMCCPKSLLLAILPRTVLAFKPKQQIKRVTPLVTQVEKKNSLHCDDVGKHGVPSQRFWMSISPQLPAKDPEKVVDLWG